jgi:hypothetical protein
MKKLIIIVSVIVVLVAAAAAVYFFFPNPLTAKKPSELMSFEDCQAAGYLVVDTKPRECHTKTGQVFIEVYNGTLLQQTITTTDPQPNSLVTTPFKVAGKAAAGWYFNELLNVRLEDDNGKTIVTKPVKALKDTKQTSGMIDFVTAIDFKTSDVTSPKGKLFIERTNPAYVGDQGPLIIPVRFDYKPPKAPDAK